MENKDVVHDYGLEIKFLQLEAQMLEKKLVGLTVFGAGFVSMAIYVFKILEAKKFVPEDIISTLVFSLLVLLVLGGLYLSTISAYQLTLERVQAIRLKLTKDNNKQE